MQPNIEGGQHRLEGICLAYEESLKQADSFQPQVCFQAIHGLSYEEETEVFNVINTTPKRLPKALTEWNKWSVTDRGLGSPEQRIRHIAVELATSKDSVWSSLVNLTGTGRDPSRPVTLEGLRRSMTHMLRVGRVQHADMDLQLRLSKFYWKTVKDVFPEAWNGDQKEVLDDDGILRESGSTYVDSQGQEQKMKPVTYRILDLVGVASLAKLGGDILQEALATPDPEGHIAAELGKISSVDWEKDKLANNWTDGNAGFAGQKPLYEALSSLRVTGEPTWERQEYSM